PGCGSAGGAADCGATRRCGPRAPRASARRLGGGVSRTSSAAPSEVRPDAEVDLERRVRIVQPVCDVDPHRSDRRAPAHAGADAAAQVGIAVERTAGVGEHRRAPALVEVVLELDAAGNDVLGAQRVQPAVGAFDAWADLAPAVAADA